MTIENPLAKVAPNLDRCDLVDPRRGSARIRDAEGRITSKSNPWRGFGALALVAAALGGGINPSPSGHVAKDTSRPKTKRKKRRKKFGRNKRKR